MAVPQRVVGEDYSAFVDEWEQSVVDLAVCALVAVDEHEVELHAQLRGFLHGVADAKVDEVGHVGAVDPFTGEVFHLVVYLESVQSRLVCPIRLVCLPGNLFQAFRHAQCRIARERANLEDGAWALHHDEHFQ